MLLTGFTVFYGGSFNPPHMGHQLSCLALLEGLGADEIWIAPTWSHPFGKALSNFDSRVKMCELMAEPFGSRARVIDVERQLGQSRTFDVMTHLQSLEPTRRFALAIGADIVGETPRWHRWEELQARVRVVVVGRGGHETVTADTPPMPAVASHLIRERSARGQPLDGLVPTRVARYIAQHGVYGAKA